MKICRVNEMREMDQRAISEFGISQELLMENAGEATYFVIKDVFGSEPNYVTLFCGIGNNGGDGLVVARKLHSIGWNPEIVLVGDAQKFKGAAKTNFDIIKKLNLPVIQFDNKAEAIGSDLNLFAYGFAIDLLVRLLKNSTILPRWPYENIPTLAPVVILVVLNGFLYMINLRLGERIKKSGRKRRTSGLKAVSLFFGFISSSSFIFVETIWG